MPRDNGVPQHQIQDLDGTITYGLGTIARPDNNVAPHPSVDKRAKDNAVSLPDFYAYMPTHTYIFVPTMQPWPASSVDARIAPIRVGVDEKKQPKYQKASAWLDKHRPVESMCWSPGDPTLINDRFLDVGGWSHRAGIRSLNVYKPPKLKHGDASQAGPWLELVHNVYREEAEHLIAYFAHRVQCPGIKPNHGLVLGGKMGIGKDSILAPVKEAVGPWNFRDVSPTDIMGEKWNDYVASVVLRVNENRDLGDVDRYSFYDHMKTYTASPPDVIRCQEKYIRHYDVLNVCGVIYTTNHKTDGMYLPGDDRRHYVAWSDRDKAEFTKEYWDGLWAWYQDGGYGHVAAHLAHYDLSNFNPKAPPPKTKAFWEIVNANRSPEATDMSNVLDYLKHPDALTLDMLIDATNSTGMMTFGTWLEDRRHRRMIPMRLEEAGYTAVLNPGNKDGQWKIGGRNRIVYAKAGVPEVDRIKAVHALADAARPARP